MEHQAPLRRFVVLSQSWPYLLLLLSWMDPASWPFLKENKLGKYFHMYKHIHKNNDAPASKVGHHWQAGARWALNAHMALKIWIWKICTRPGHSRKLSSDLRGLKLGCALVLSVLKDGLPLEERSGLPCTVFSGIPEGLVLLS